MISDYILNRLNLNQNIVCYSSESKVVYSTDQLLQAIHFTQKKIDVFENQNWLLYAKNSYSFLIGLLSLVGKGKTIHLPQNFQINNLVENHFDCQSILTDHPLEIEQTRNVVNINQKPMTESHDCHFESTNQSKLFLHTSGSTGKPKLIEKNISNLINEVISLEKSLPEKTKMATIIATVSHQHIYGLLFKILWPFLTNRPFVIESLLFPNEISEQVASHENSILISSPAHLSRIPELIDLKEWKNKVSLITSSGGPLSFETAKKINHTFGQPPLEIFGSTETGGIATRVQNSINSSWTPFPEVSITISSEGTLCVKSPFIKDENIFETEDLIILNPDNTFHLRGRRDRIIKIEEKRISLPEMEEKIKSHNEVKDCVVIPIQAKEDSQRIILGALLEIDLNNNTDQVSLKNKIIETLKLYYEKVVIPKSWRFTDKIPVNQQSKKQLYQVLKHFNQDSFQNEFDVLNEQIINENIVNLECRVAKNYLYFNGHFPDFPILPGIAQVHSIVKFSQKYFNIKTEPIGLSHLKFKNIIFPENKFSIKLTHQPSNGILSYELSRQTQILASGKINFATQPATSESNV